ncbi:MAG: hypothetical protein KBD06_01750 [Candidatus Pacebacteria bacterium]|nr:hypothetical protein [Candidatus Paceibacterota bacterium]
MKQRQIFIACRKAIPHVHGLGADNAESEQVEEIKTACRTLRLLIRELCLETPPEALLLIMRDVLLELHPDIPYGEDPMLLVRDIADVMITLDRLVETRHRSDETKILQAQIFCMRLSEEDSLVIPS